MKNLTLSICVFFIAIGQLNAQCDCLESSEIPANQLVLCENFDTYVNGSNFPNNNPKWSLWPGTTSFAQIQTPAGSSKALHIRENGSSKPDLLLKLANKTAGRYRLSWRMFIPKGKTAKYNVQHRESGNHWAFSVTFGNNGIGSAEMLRNTVSQFPYLVGAWNKVMHIVDLDEDLVELWINDEFVDAWKFSLGYTTPTNEVNLNQLGAVNFFSENATSEYYVDNICMWQPTNAIISTIYDPVCVKNGETVGSPASGRYYKLYTSKEYLDGPCTSVCDLDKNGDTYLKQQIDEITLSDYFPNSLFADSENCISTSYPKKSRKQLHGKSYAYEAPGTRDGVDVTIGRLAGDLSSVNLFVYNCNSGTCAKPEFITRDSDEIRASFGEIPVNSILILISTAEVKYSIFALPSGLVVPFACPEIFRQAINLNQPQTINFRNTESTNSGYPEFQVSKLFKGREMICPFEINEPMLFDISVSTTGTGAGIFLYGEKCGIDPIASSVTTSDFNGKASIQTWLGPGNYNLLIDQILDIQSGNCILEIKTKKEESPLNKQTGIVCFPSGSSAHRITIRGTPLYLDGVALTLSDKIYIINNETGVNKLVQARNWNGIEVNFFLPIDEVSDSKKCGYFNGELFNIYIVKGDNVFPVRAVFQAVDGVEVTAEEQFKKGGRSLITGFYSKGDGSVFGIQTIPRLSSNSKKFFVSIIENANRRWKIENKASASANWLKIAPLEGIGGDDLEFTVSANQSTTFRQDTIFLIRDDGIIKFIILEQPGCTGPSVTADPDQTVCANQPINLTATGVGTISWRTPTGNTVSGTRLSSTVTSTQTFTAIATLNGCTATDEVKITVSAGLNANAGLDQTICPGSSTTLTASGGTAYRWSNGKSGAQIPVDNLTQTTTYTVTISQNGCETTDQVVVNVASTVADAGPAKSVCAGSTVTLQASGGGIYRWSTNETTSSIKVTPGTSTTYRVFVTNNGCSAEATVLVTVIPSPLASAGPGQTTCAGEPVTLTASGGGTYLWSDKNATTAQIKVAPTTNTNYVVSVTQGGCTSTANVLVRVNPKPVANAGLDKNVCQGEFATLIATGGGTYNWSTGATAAIVNVRPSSMQTYGLTVTTNGCTDTDSITIFIRPKPVVTLAESRLIFGPTGFLKMNVSSGTPGYRYQWYRNDTLISTQKDLFGLRTGIYKLIVTDAIGCSVTFGPQAIVTTSTIDPMLNRNIQIFPNPSTTLIHIQFELEQATSLEISILDGLGKNIWHQNQRNFFREKLEVDLSNHPAGMYWVQFTTENGAFYKKIMRL